MKSNYCAKYVHNVCQQRFHLHSYCDCQCHADVAQTEEHLTNQEVVGSIPAVSYQGPPPHPAPVDRGKWRIADEPPGTDLTQPWVLGTCEECKDPTWAHSAKAVANRELLCETCSYNLVSELADLRVAAESRRAPRIIDPFSNQ